MSIFSGLGTQLIDIGEYVAMQIAKPGNRLPSRFKHWIVEHSFAWIENNPLTPSPFDEDPSSPPPTGADKIPPSSHH